VPMYMERKFMFSESMEAESKSEEDEEGEKLRVGIVGFAHKDSLLITNRDTSTLPCILSSYVQVIEYINPRSILDDIMGALVEHPNLRKSDEEMIQRGELAGDDCLNLRANSSQDGEDDTSATMKINVWTSSAKYHPRKCNVET